MPKGIYIRSKTERERLSKGVRTGKVNSEETKKLISKALKGKMPKNIQVLINASLKKNWKGDNVGYRALHRWVEVRLGKATYCENNSIHISSRYHWANISGVLKHERFIDRRVFI